MRKHILIAAAIAIALSLIVLGVVKRNTAATRDRAAAQSHSLREKAKANGSVTVLANPEGMKRYNEVKGLVRDSTDIVNGSLVQAVSRFRTAEEQTIVTDFQVSVQDVLKGDITPGGVIIIRGPGGRMQFEDGTSAEIKMPYYWKNPELGKTYTLFLRKKGNVLMLTGGPQGFFEIFSHDTVLPQVRAEDELMQRYKDKDSLSFLEEVNRSVKQEQPSR